MQLNISTQSMLVLRNAEQDLPSTFRKNNESRQQPRARERAEVKAARRLDLGSSSSGTGAIARYPG
jgi:hypothetical protein